MSIFKCRHFKYDIIIWAVRWYCKYGISYRDLEEILIERGIAVDHSTIYRWIQYYAPKIVGKLKWYWKPKMGLSCLYVTRDIKAAKLFLAKALKSIPEYCNPKSINTDQNPTYSKAITNLKAEGKCSIELKHRQIKYMNDIDVSGKVKAASIKPTLGFKSMKTAYATIKGFEIMRMFKKGRFDLWK